MPGRRLVVVSNREPYSHHHVADGIVSARTAGGLTVALDAVMQAARRLVDRARQRRRGPRGRGRARPHRLPARPAELHAPPHLAHARGPRPLLLGFANSALWPLCHVVYVRRVPPRGLGVVPAVNRRFADAVLEEVGGQPALVFLQDYHLALAAKYIRERRPDLQLAMFWHIPWPNPEVFRVLPWKEEILEGILATDLVGFHIRRHATNFLDSVSETLEARVDFERSRWTGAAGARGCTSSDQRGRGRDRGALRDGRDAPRRGGDPRTAGLHGCKIGLGVDRLDYTKGIPSASRRSSGCSRSTRNGRAASPSSRSACPRASSFASTGPCRTG